MEEQRLSELERRLFLRVTGAGRHLHSARLRGDVGGEVFQLGGLVFVAENPAHGIFAAAALEREHAMDEARLQVHDAIGIGEVAGQVGVRALQHARAEAEVAFLKRRLARTVGLFPKLLASHFEELHRTALGDHPLVALDFLLGVLRACCAAGEGGGRCNGECCEYPPHQAIAVSVRLDSPTLSTQLTSTLSPFAPPFTRNVNTGLRETPWLIWLSTTVLPFSFTVMFWIKCIGTSLPSWSLRCPVS